MKWKTNHTHWHKKTTFAIQMFSLRLLIAHMQSQPPKYLQKSPFVTNCQLLVRFNASPQNTQMLNVNTLNWQWYKKKKMTSKNQHYICKGVQQLSAS